MDGSLQDRSRSTRYDRTPWLDWERSATIAPVAPETPNARKNLEFTHMTPYCLRVLG